MEQWYKCPQCAQDVLYGTNPCPYCKGLLAWSQQGPILYTPPADAQQQVTQPPLEVPQQTVNRAGGSIVCANCGNSIIPVKSKFGCGWFILWFLLGIIPGLFYLIYYAGKRADICPVCEKNAYKLVN